MSDDFDWIDAGETGGVGTDIIGCFPWAIGAAIVIGIIWAIAEWGPDVIYYFYG